MPRAGGGAPSVARSIETGAVLGVLVVILALTGLGLSPTVAAALPPMRYVQATFNLTFYVAHMASAALLVAFLVWHLLPFRHAFSRKPGVRTWVLAMGHALLALVLVEVATGVVLYLHAYDLLGKREAVLVHLATTFLLLAPLVVHALRGVRVWSKRRAARMAALGAAHARGRLPEARAQQDAVTRRAFLRLAAYAVAGFALAATFARFTAGQLAAWRLNFVGDTPRLSKDTYVLRVTGLVGKPLELTFDQLTRLPSRTLEMTHRCVEGWTYTDVFTGVPLKEVVQLAGGLKEGAAQLVFKSPEVSKQAGQRGKLYTTNVPAADAARDDLYLVYAVRGQDLPPEHGFPVRIMSPGKWGYKACKWLVEIEATADAGYRGYWEALGYHPVGDWPGPIFG